MRHITFLIITLSLFVFSGCEHCKEVILEPCGETTITNSEHCGWTVATHYAFEERDPVASIYDTRFNSTAPLGGDWGSTLVPTRPSNWTSAQIGQVFGIAIDHQENIYLASSDIYFSSGFPSSNIGRPYTPGQIFKCTPPSWNAVPFAVLPNTGGNLNGVGNIAFDKWNQQLFATNIEDGMIYRIDLTTGAIVNTYDPWATDDGSASVCIQDEQVWGIAINQEGADIKVYFPRITNRERSIYSITLSGGDFPVSGSEILEITNIPGNQLMITDLAFSSNGTQLLIAERGNPHQSKVMSYNLSGGTWIFNQKYNIGANAGNDGENSAGGIDFAYTEIDQNPSAVCDEYFWASGNFMKARNSSLSLLYGMEGISYAGNNSSTAPLPTANQDTDLFIDYDGVDGTQTKGGIGDVEVLDCYDCIDPCTLKDIL